MVSGGGEGFRLPVLAGSRVGFHRSIAMEIAVARAFRWKCDAKLMVEPDKTRHLSPKL